jgi:SpoVK/Ycf46/Vps4 family AAA+-type ATPase
MIKHKKFLPETIVEEKKQIIRKSGILEYFNSDENVGSIGGNDVLIKWAIQRKNAFTEKARKFGIPYPKGIILSGIPGCGKSLFCKIIANIWGFPLLRMSMDKVFEGTVGSSERNMKRVLDIAEAVSPCILWIDEIEKALSGLGSSNVSDGGTTSRVCGIFLSWLQENKLPVFVAGTANDISALPPELLRKGRFDEIWFVDLPNHEERKEIFKIHISKRRRKVKDFDLDALVDSSETFTGAEIENAIVSGLFDAYDENTELTTEHIKNNLEQTIPLSSTMEDKIISLRNWAKGKAKLTTARSFLLCYLNITILDVGLE